MTYDRPPVVLVDMDGVVVDLEAAFWLRWADEQPDAPQRADVDPTVFHVLGRFEASYHAAVAAILDEPGFYADLPTVPGAVEALTAMLDAGLDVRLCTAPRLSNPTCASDKITSAVRHLGAGWAERTIITRDKSMVRGDLLVDDKPTVTTTLTPTWKHVVFDTPYNRTSRSPYRLTGWDAWETTVTPLLGRIAA